MNGILVYQVTPHLSAGSKAGIVAAGLLLLYIVWVMRFRSTRNGN